MLFHIKTQFNIQLYEYRIKAGLVLFKHNIMHSEQIFTQYFGNYFRKISKRLT